MCWRGYLILLSLCWTGAVSAWQVELDDEQIYVSSDSNYQAVQVYLAWFNMDLPAEQAISSWRIEGGWQLGVKPIVDESIDVSPFALTQVDSLPRVCVQEHRCFLALLALPSGADPLITTNWQASMVLPLSPKAALERFPGQSGFNNFQTSPVSERLYEDVFFSEAVPASVALGAADTAVVQDQSNDATAANSDNTEKPDIFKFINDKLIYANSAAKRLQIIDLADPTQAVLKISQALAQQPKEIYSLDNFYLLLQSQWSNSANQTQIDVFSYDDALAATNSLAQISSIVLPGLLQQSRRRDDVIYAVLQGNQTVIYPEIINTNIVANDFVIGEWQQLSIQALRLDALGHLDSVGYEVIGGYDAKISIFADHLLVTHQNSQDWGSSKIDVFDLSDSAAPLRAMGSITVQGYVPSEFHVSVRDQYLQVVYQNRDRSLGSHLAVYDLSATNLPLLGEVGGIAPGERLYATRFSPDYAYVVTFRQTDPLWVIDLADPQAPKIVGELKVPGWSEKLFFNNGRLFAVGYDDRAGREASLSLFDVSDPTQPDILDRFTPESNSDRTYTTSPAISDERALLLNWSSAFTALPVYNAANPDPYRLHLLNFGLDRFVKRGYVSFPEPVSRSFIIDNEHLGVLGSNNFYTVKWGADIIPDLIATVPLARHLDQILMQTDRAWGVNSNNGKVQAIYELNPQQIEDNLTLSGTKIDLSDFSPHSNELLINDNYVAITQNYPFSLQMFNLSTGQFSNTLEFELNLNNTRQWLQDNIWYQSGLAYTNLYAYPQTDITNTHLYDRYDQEQWLLTSVQAENQQLTALHTYITPGQVLGQNLNAEFISFEVTPKGQLRFNRLTAVSAGLRLLQSEVFSCQNQTPHYNLGWLYILCNNTMGQTDLLKIDAQNFELSQIMAFPDNYQLSLVNADVLLIEPRYHYYTNDLVRPLALERRVLPYTDEQTCLLMQVTDTGLENLYQFEQCPSPQQIGFNAHSAYVANGYASVDLIRY